jgi:DNA-binding NtrC family response regulator
MSSRPVALFPESEAGAVVPGPASTAVLYVPASQEHLPVVARLRELGLSVVVAAHAADAVRLLDRRGFTFAFVDLTEDRSPIVAIRSIRAQRPELYLAGLMDPARPLVAAEAIRAGVVDLLTWPLDEHDVALTVANALDRSSIDLPNVNRARGAPGETLFANSASMRVMMERVRAAATEPGGVLLCGERGSGRELVARAIHARSDRAAHPFLAVDCGAGTLHELEMRLFGLVTDRRSIGPERRGTERVGPSGAIYQAHGGTLLLRNIVDAPTRVQTKLGRILRDREVLLSDTRVLVDLDFRPMAAVDSGLDAAIADERIRSELYDRLSQVRIEVPPFRRRREDIPLIAVSVLREVCEKRRIPVKTCSRAALVMLAALPWPGNGRELRTLLDTVVKSVPRPVVQLDDLFEHVRLDGLAARVEAGATLRDAKARFERDWISAVLMKHHGRVGEAAKALGIQRTNLYRKVRQLKVARTLLGPRRPRP